MLGKGELLGIYPEARASHDGRLYKGKGRRRGDGPQGGRPGGSLRDDRHLRGTAARQEDPPDPPGGDPFRRAAGLLALRGDENEKGGPARATDEIMYAILSLSGQEYVDQYAAVAKAADAEREAEDRRRFPRMPLS
ncbi:hypothetical protein GCM10023238_23680 [Streptomyces heliomycini]